MVAQMVEQKADATDEQLVELLEQWMADSKAALRDVLRAALKVELKAEKMEAQ